MAAQFYVAAAMETLSGINLDYCVPAISLTTGGPRPSVGSGHGSGSSSPRKSSSGAGKQDNDSRYDHLVKLENGRVRCNLCSSTYSCLISARAHTVRVHEQPEYFECSLCGKIFRTKLNFRSHLNLSHGIKGSNLVAQYGRKIDMMDDYVESSDMIVNE